MASSEVEMGTVSWDSSGASLNYRSHVRVKRGRLTGVVGTAIRTVGNGRLLVELQRGVYVELDADCLESVD